MRYYGLDYHSNRVLCSVLDEIRKLDSTKNYSSLLSLIEEAQAMANRMEAALYDKKDLFRARDEVRVLKEEIKLLREEKQNLNKELGKKEIKDENY